MSREMRFATIEDFVNPQTKVYKDPSVFSRSYIPSSFLFREGEWRSIGNLLAGFLKSRDVLGYISGPPGTGKTHMAQKLIQMFTEYAAKEEIKCRFIVINCRKLTYPAVIGQLARIYEPGYALKRKSVHEILVDITKMFKQENVLIVFDEADKIIPSPPYNDPYDALFGDFSRFEEIYRVKNKVGCIIIANNPSLDAGVEASTRSSFVPTRIEFKNYAAGEIRDILWERCELGFQDGLIDLSTIAAFAKHLKSYSHDLRVAFQVLAEVGEYINTKGEKRIEIEDLIDVLKIVEKKELVEMIIGLEDLQKILLFLIAHICKKNKKDHSAATSDAVWEALQLYSKRFKGVEEKSQRHIFERVLPNLEAQGFFTTGSKGLGRGKGRVKYFSIQESNLELFYDALLEQMPATVENWSITGDILSHNKDLLKNGELKRL